MESLFDTVAGLPLHPLVVHFAVVLLPLAVIGVLAAIWMPRTGKRYLTLSAIGVLLGTLATFIAKESGEALAERVGLPQRHSDLGTY
ncbi:MAG: cytochrome b5 domain-containing protein, partial [Actinobacteria bacterium]|nr:cytochrome b5 domain-containing protein [Actinomycetota bacterium]